MNLRIAPFFLLSTPLLFSIGCGSSDGAALTVGDAIDEFSFAYCEQIRSCFPAEEFDAAFPNGLSECMDLVKEPIPKDRWPKQSACSGEQLDACVHDVNIIECSSLGSAFPSSCDCSQ